MPKIWINPKVKYKFVTWDNKDHSDNFQVWVTTKVCDLLRLDLKKAVQLREDFKKNKKQFTKEKKLSILDTKKPEV